MSLLLAQGAQFRRASDQSLLIYFGNQITVAAHEQVRKLLWLLESDPIPGVRNLHPAYCSLLIKFDPQKLWHDTLERKLKSYLARLQTLPLPEPQRVQIPVCYGGDYGPDLDEISVMHGLTPAQAIELHASATYLVFFLGFVPGFAYLGGLPESLITPRLATPRRSVPAGSVGIAGSQTGVYPLSTPGGWRLIGRTPMAMFRPDSTGLGPLSIGDRVRFMPISRERFAELERA
jgi:inhibitor of KinA